MPQVRFNCVNSDGEDRIFEISGGCFQILGRYSENLEIIHEKMRNRGCTEIQSLSWFIPYSLNEHKMRPEDKDRLPLLEYLFKTFDFMKCVQNTPEDILETGYVHLDVLGYEFLAVQHAMWHIRSAVIYGEPYVFKHLVENGCTERSAYATYCLGPVIRKFHDYGEASTSELETCQGGDENMYRFLDMSSKNWMMLCSGELQRDFSGHLMYNELISENKRYSESVSNFGCTDDIGESDAVSDLTWDLFRVALELTKQEFTDPEDSEKFSTFGFSFRSQRFRVHSVDVKKVFHLKYAELIELKFQELQNNHKEQEAA